MKMDLNDIVKVSLSSCYHIFRVLQLSSVKVLLKMFPN